MNCCGRPTGCIYTCIPGYGWRRVLLLPLGLYDRYDLPVPTAWMRPGANGTPLCRLADSGYRVRRMNDYCW